MRDGRDTRSSPSTLEPPAAAFRLLHIVRAPEHDRVDKQAFDAFIELVGIVELRAPCLYYLAPQERRCGFALAEHAPAGYFNQLMMLVVDQERGYESFAEFEGRVRARARRVLAATGSVAIPDAAPPPIPEPPSWAVEMIPSSMDFGELFDEGDFEG